MIAAPPESASANFSGRLAELSRRVPINMKVARTLGERAGISFVAAHDAIDHLILPRVSPSIKIFDYSRADLLVAGPRNAAANVALFQINVDHVATRLGVGDRPLPVDRRVKRILLGGLQFLDALLTHSGFDAFANRERQKAARGFATGANDCVPSLRTPAPNHVTFFFKPLGELIRSARVTAHSVIRYHIDLRHFI